MDRFVRSIALALFAACPALLVSASAQESAISPISTERPTAGYSPDVIPGGSLQIENGIGVSLQGGHFDADLPDSLVRLGLFDRFEVRFQTSDDMYTSQAAPGVPRWQTADTQIGGKLLIGTPNSLLPRSAVLSLNLPTGGVSQTSGSYDPSTALIWTQSPPHGWFINEVAIATLTTFDGGRRPAWAPSVAAGKSLNSRLTLFGECAPTLAQNGSVSWLADGGFVLLRRATQQIDFRGGYLADSAGVHTLLSVGFSVRRDNLFKLLQSPPINLK